MIARCRVVGICFAMKTIACCGILLFGFKAINVYNIIMVLSCTLKLSMVMYSSSRILVPGISFLRTVLSTVALFLKSHAEY